MKNTLTIIFCFLLDQTQAQYMYPDQEVAILIKNKDLVVQLLPESSGVEKALNKKIQMFYEALSWDMPVDKANTIERFF